jgi:hypothetical protein
LPVIAELTGAEGDVLGSVQPARQIAAVRIAMEVSFIEITSSGRISLGNIIGLVVA